MPPARSWREDIKDGKLMAEEKVETTVAPAAVELTPDRSTVNSDGEDLSIITLASPTHRAESFLLRRI
jgi:hypothetical protein